MGGRYYLRLSHIVNKAKNIYIIQYALPSTVNIILVEYYNKGLPLTCHDPSRTDGFSSSYTATSCIADETYSPFAHGCTWTGNLQLCLSAGHGPSCCGPSEDLRADRLNPLPLLQGGVTPAKLCVTLSYSGRNGHLGRVRQFAKKQIWWDLWNSPSALT